MTEQHERVVHPRTDCVAEYHSKRITDESFAPRIVEVLGETFPERFVRLVLRDFKHGEMTEDEAVAQIKRDVLGLGGES